VGKLFRRPDSIDDVIKRDREPESKNITIPKDLSETIFLKEAGIGSELLFIKTLETIYRLGDIDDFRYISEEVAKGLFDQIVDTNLLSWLKDNDLEDLVSHLNKLLLSYKLGYIQLDISEEEKNDFEIHLYDSLTVVFGKRVGTEEETICSFYEVIFSSLFSKIFGETVVVKEKSCAIKGGKSCDFEVKMG
jgi:predicted hydrocarbon binding protein